MAEPQSLKMVLVTALLGYSSHAESLPAWSVQFSSIYILRVVQSYSLSIFRTFSLPQNETLGPLTVATLTPCPIFLICFQPQAAINWFSVYEFVSLKSTYDRSLWPVVSGFFHLAKYFQGLYYGIIKGKYFLFKNKMHSMKHIRDTL